MNYTFEWSRLTTLKRSAEMRLTINRLWYAPIMPCRAVLEANILRSIEPECVLVLQNLRFSAILFNLVSVGIHNIKYRLKRGAI